MNSALRQYYIALYLVYLVRSCTCWASWLEFSDFVLMPPFRLTRNSKMLRAGCMAEMDDQGRAHLQPTIEGGITKQRNRS